MSKILFTPEAYAKVQALVQACAYEINGIGRVTPIGDNFLIDDIAVLKQIVTSASTEMDTDDLANFLAVREDYNQWKLQWHSHVNMGVFWSGTDENAIRTIGETADWVMSIVFNKRREYKSRVDVFNVTSSVPQPIAHLFNIPHNQATTNDLIVEIYNPVEDYTDWAEEMILQKVRQPRPYIEEPKKNKWWDDETDLQRPIWSKPQAEETPTQEDEWSWNRWPLSEMVKMPIQQIWQIMANLYGTTPKNLKTEYDETAIKDLFEDYLMDMTPEERAKF